MSKIFQQLKSELNYNFLQKLNVKIVISWGRDAGKYGRQVSIFCGTLQDGGTVCC
jgi:hypothetical protein